MQNRSLPLRAAARLALAADTLSITVMEIVDNAHRPRPRPRGGPRASWARVIAAHFGSASSLEALAQLRRFVTPGTEREYRRS